MRAAVPAYVGNNFQDCPPGHRFGLYFEVWKDDDWSLEREQKGKALERTLRLPSESVRQLEALRERQEILLDVVPGDARLSVIAKSTAPFATGMGMEHPLENGFAFLNPYGLPYLPGSSIKGVLRRAAEELLDAEENGAGQANQHLWSKDDAITALFGRETEDREKEHSRGAITFWDCLPKPKKDLGMEVMTPHQGAYYQAERSDAYPEGASPHDSGQPIPIVFLVVPPDAEFAFHLVCDTRRLPDSLRGTWQALMRAALVHAFEWLGFGAKTAVGYGAMACDTEAEAEAEGRRSRRAAEAEETAARKREAAQKAAELAKLDPVERSVVEFLAQRPDKNQSEISAVLGSVKQGRWAGEEKIAVAGWLQRAMRATRGEWKEVSQAKKPEKDREFQNTQLVVKWLRGE